MDTQEHSDQILEKLGSIERQLTSLRYTFGIGLIILTLLITFLVPSLTHLYLTQGQGSWQAGTPGMLQQMTTRTGPATTTP